MAMRNYWIDANIEGRKTPLTGGPQGKEGGFKLKVNMRDDGESVEALTISGMAKGDGGLLLTVEREDGHVVYFREAKR